MCGSGHAYHPVPSNGTVDGEFHNIPSTHMVDGRVFR